MGVYAYINRFLADPIYHAHSFWTLPCSYLDKVLISLQKVEKDRTQADSITTAYLTDSLHSIAHAIYGQKESPYKSNPAAYLPGYQPEQTEDIETLQPNTETIKILLAQIRAKRISSLVIDHLNQMLPDWVAKYS